MIIDELEVKIINKSHHKLPEYADSGSAGFDLRAYFENGDDLVLQPFDRMLIPTGLYVELPTGYELQVRPRSGLAIKSGITVLNTPGTVDSTYRGEIGVILINMSKEPFVIHDGDRIAQAVVAEYKKVTFTEVDVLSETERGEGGFGHTGVK